MSYLVECVAGPSRHAFGRGALRQSSARPVIRGAPRRAGPLARRLQSTSASAPVVVETAGAIAETSVLDPLANLLLSSPLPAWATIIALTLSVRTGITLPVSLWQRRRMLREATEVRPRMKQINEQLAVSVMKDCRSKGISYEGYKKELKTKLAAEQAALHKRFKTHPTVTMAAPLVVHVPLLITVSLTLRRALELPGSSMAAEGMWWIDTLGDVDPIGALPILGAVVALTNAETLGRKREQAMSAVAGRENLQARPTSPPRPPASSARTKVEASPESAAKYTPPPSVHRTRRLSTSAVSSLAIRPSRGRPQRVLEDVPASDAAPKGMTESEKASVRSTFLTYVLRGMALVFIPFASSVPAALALYWVSSLTYTLGQTLVLSKLDQKVAMARRAAVRSKNILPT